MIRELCKGDIARCLEIYNYYIVNDTATFEITPLSLSAFMQRVETIQAEDPWLVYEENGCVLGYAYLSPYSEREAFAASKDFSVYVDAQVRGKGIGRKLMMAVLEAARARGVHLVVSVITCGNEASEKLHHACGFVKTGELPEAGCKFGKQLGVSFFVKLIEE